MAFAGTFGRSDPAAAPRRLALDAVWRDGEAAFGGVSG